MEDRRTRPGYTGERIQSPYRAWQESEGIPINRGSYIPDLHEVPVAPWTRFGQRGAFANLGAQEKLDTYVLEIAPGGETKVARHCFEVSIYVLSGRGATSIWLPGKEKQTVEWQRGSIFSPPLNTFYQHFNLEGQGPARLFAMTTAPRMINLFRTPDFVFNAQYVFADRYNAQDNYFTDPGEHMGWRQYRTNFIPDIRAFKLDDYSQRGAGGNNMHFVLANNSVGGHVSEFPPATYKKAHRHGVGPHVIILDGEGYSLFWNKGEPRRRVDWKDGAIVVPGNMEYHQHFNTGPTTARYLAFATGGAGTQRRGDTPDAPPPTATSEREGGLQVEYEDEDPAIYEEFEADCRKHGATPALPRQTYRS